MRICQNLKKKEHIEGKFAQTEFGILKYHNIVSISAPAPLNLCGLQFFEKYVSAKDLIYEAS